MTPSITQPVSHEDGRVVRVDAGGAWSRFRAVRAGWALDHERGDCARIAQPRRLYRAARPRRHLHGPGRACEVELFRPAPSLAQTCIRRAHPAPDRREAREAQAHCESAGLQIASGWRIRSRRAGALPWRLLRGFLPGDGIADAQAELCGLTR